MTEKNYIDQFVLEEKGTSPSGDTLCYYVTSTAPKNVEDEDKQIDIEKQKEKLAEIVDHLAEENSEIVIFIHGYANEQKYTEEICQKMLKYADALKNNSQEKNNNDEKKKIVFLGYFWPSEKPFTEWCNVVTFLPYLFKWLFFTPPLLFLITFVISLILPQCKILLSILNSYNLLWYLAAFAFFVIVFTLVLLRSLTYFRDSYRATNYGVPDLVEILRQIEQFVKRKGQNETKKIKLNFIGYSMGCFVATNTIRILSDVFDDNAIERNPGSNIGNVFCLGRLVLVAPDIPLLTITSGRANFLRSSLRRCEEAYVFCNEGDLALRLASTIANYISFPAQKRKNGYRLGNISVKSKDEEYGIIKLANDDDTIFDQLEIRLLNDKSDVISKEFKCSYKEILANKFTYFDCTDYIDTQDDAKKYAQGIVSFAKRKPQLNLCDYICLVFADFVKIPWRTRIDTHGG
ncbi:hypothetical protein A2T98_03015 [Nodularia spumigena CENA596]|uniref:Alpha/beta hydrolase n=1 Tax=Nodularia spumigena CENA596 TaxID=1819295 RepID=A0A161VV83_NODSP|nr:alpha/beta hydrolase [Nodularia spumigena]KZL51285.1 hypothetical protein A2T98_03015 [Nodularia spumigena CENA596]